MIKLIKNPLIINNKSKELLLIIILGRTFRATLYCKRTALFCRLPLPTLSLLARGFSPWRPAAVIGTARSGFIWRKVAPFQNQKNWKVWPLQLPQLRSKLEGFLKFSWTNCRALKYTLNFQMKNKSPTQKFEKCMLYTSELEVLLQALDEPLLRMNLVPGSLQSLIPV